MIAGMNKTCRALLPLLLFLVTVSGCVSKPFRPDNPPGPGLVVEVYQNINLWGCGAVVGPRFVLTTEHVLDGSSTARVNGYPAKVVARYTSVYEELVLLELDSSAPAFSARDIFKVTPGARPFEVWSIRGKQTYSPSLVISGDSGSPVVTTSGSIVGLIYGRRHPSQVDWVSNARKVVPGQKTMNNRVRSGFKLPQR